LYVNILREYGEHYLLADRVDTEAWRQKQAIHFATRLKDHLVYDTLQNLPTAKNDFLQGVISIPFSGEGAFLPKWPLFLD